MNRRHFLKLAASSAFAGMPLTSSQSALVPPYFTFCVVALGGQLPDIRDGQFFDYKWTAVGTGFFVGYLERPDPDLGKRLYSPYLVTAKHVVDGWNAGQEIAKSKGFKPSPLMIRVNPKLESSSASDFDLNVIKNKGGPGWTFNPNGKDVAVLGVDIGDLRKDYGVTFFPDDETVANIDKLKALQVSAGDGIFVLGFPMGLIGEKHNAVIVREGVIARIEDMLYGTVDSFLIDSFVFPGNSGGPVILKPEAVSIQGTPIQNKSYLIGMVDAYQPYRETAVSQQTQEPRVIFEENSGLATILPCDYILDTIVADDIIEEGFARRGASKF